jgi:RNase P subunit RPR2
VSDEIYRGLPKTTVYFVNPAMAKEGYPRISNVECLERINFLAQAARQAAQDPDLADLGQYLGTEMDLMAKKSVIRYRAPGDFCKKCKAPLVPPVSSSISVKNGYSVVRCSMCDSVTRVYHNKKVSESRSLHHSYIQDIDRGGEGPGE